MLSDVSCPHFWHKMVCFSTAKLYVFLNIGTFNLNMSVDLNQFLSLKTILKAFFSAQRSTFKSNLEAYLIITLLQVQSNLKY